MAVTAKKGSKKMSEDIADRDIEEKEERSQMEMMFSRLINEFTKSFNVCLDKVVTAIEEKLTLRLDVSDREVHDLNVRLDAMERTTAELRAENSELKAQMTSLQTKLDQSHARLDDLEQYSRVDNLLVHGLAATEQPEKNLSKNIVDMINSNFSNITISEQDISTVHRLGRPTPTTGASPVQKPLPVIIRFTRRIVRDSILSSRKELKGKRISITEQLIQSRALILKKASDLVTKQRLSAAWSHDGKILVKSFDGRTTMISTEEGLTQFM